MVMLNPNLQTFSVFQLNLCNLPGLQQLETAPAHCSGGKSPVTAGQDPTQYRFYIPWYLTLFFFQISFIILKNFDLRYL